MQKVIQFLISKINFICFLLLEIVCFVLIYSNNPYQRAAFFNSSNAMVGEWLGMAKSTTEYLALRSVNEQLALENALLKQQLRQRKIQADPSFTPADSEYVKKYEFIMAKVINNSTSHFHNYFTINKGLNDSIAPGMGVLCAGGVAGKVKSCSKHFSTVTSVLHKEMLVSSKLKRTGTVGSVKWEGLNPDYVKLMYIPRHIGVKKGDTIVTSEYNAVFPEGEMVGIVHDINIRGDENFYNITVKLSTDFLALEYVYVIKNRFKAEQDSLETLNPQDQNETR